MLMDFGVQWALSRLAGAELIYMPIETYTWLVSVVGIFTWLFTACSPID